MSSKDDNDTPPTSKEEAAARSVRPSPEKYDPDKRSRWSITMTVAWIIWRDLDAVRNEWDDYRNECADWKFEGDHPRARALRARVALDNFERALEERRSGHAPSDPDLQKKLQEELEELEKREKKPSWRRQWPPSRWGRLCLRAISEAVLEPRQQTILPPQDAIDELWQQAAEGRIEATAVEYENDKAYVGKQIKIPAHYWPHLKRTDDPLTGKAMLSGPDGRVYREVQFSRLDAKKLWPKPPSLSGEPIEPDAVEVLPEPEPAKPAEPKSKAKPTPESKQQERAERYITKNYPKGTDGVSPSVIYRKLKKDTELEAELKEDKVYKDVPSLRTIRRMLNRPPK